MTTWLITGCSTGLGRAFAVEALARGNDVVVTARDAANVQDLADRFPEHAVAASPAMARAETAAAAPPRLCTTRARISDASRRRARAPSVSDHRLPRVGGERVLALQIPDGPAVDWPATTDPLGGVQAAPCRAAAQAGGRQRAGAPESKECRPCRPIGSRGFLPSGDYG